MTTPESPLALTASRQLPAWLAEQRISLAFTTYQAGKLFFLGLNPNGSLAVAERTFARCLGLWASPDAQTLWLSTLYQLWRFVNVVPSGELADGADRLYLPLQAHTTGDLDTHDIAVEDSGRLVFVNTLFSCLATLGNDSSFVPLWNPPFVTRLAAEDRCHLNGLGTRDGRVRYVTLIGPSDVADGWRAHRASGGMLIDVQRGETLLDGLAMPHSPRWHQGRLWLLESAAGFLGYLDPASGRFERVCFCPGYARGLAFAGNYAIVGLSGLRQNRTFQGLPLDDELRRHGATPRCGLLVVDLRTGDTVHWLWLEGVVEELYDVAVLPGVVRPQALGFQNDTIRRVLRVGDPQPLF